MNGEEKLAHLFYTLYQGNPRAAQWTALSSHTQAQFLRIARFVRKNFNIKLPCPKHRPTGAATTKGKE